MSVFSCRLIRSGSGAASSAEQNAAGVSCSFLSVPFCTSVLSSRSLPLLPCFQCQRCRSIAAVTGFSSTCTGACRLIGSKSREYFVITPAQNGGAACPSGESVRCDPCPDMLLCLHLILASCLLVIITAPYSLLAWFPFVSVGEHGLYDCQWNFIDHLGSLCEALDRRCDPSGFQGSTLIHVRDGSVSTNCTNRPMGFTSFEVFSITGFKGCIRLSP